MSPIFKRRRKGKRGQGTGHKTIVTGIPERGGKISGSIVTDVKDESLMNLRMVHNYLFIYPNTGYLTSAYQLLVVPAPVKIITGSGPVTLFGKYGVIVILTTARRVPFYPCLLQVLPLTVLPLPLFAIQVLT